MPRLPSTCQVESSFSTACHWQAGGLRYLITALSTYADKENHLSVSSRKGYFCSNCFQALVERPVKRRHHDSTSRPAIGQASHRNTDYLHQRPRRSTPKNTDGLHHPTLTIYASFTDGLHQNATASLQYHGRFSGLTVHKVQNKTTTARCCSSLDF